MYYPSSENKGADQLRSYCEADLRLCFRICRLLVFPCGGSNHYENILMQYFIEFSESVNIGGKISLKTLIFFLVFAQKHRLWVQVTTVLAIHLFAVEFRINYLD